MNKRIFYDGKWKQSANDNWIEVCNPANGDHLGNVSNANYDDMKRVIEAAHAGFKSWSQETAYFRCDLLEKLYDLIIEEKEEIAKIITMENGKPYLEALGEVTYGASFIKWYSEEGKRVYGEFIPSSSRDKRVMTRRQPVGVVYAITPWNFPFAMITRKLAPALASGCTIIVKPAEETPLTAIKLFELIERVGFPNGVANLITGEPIDLTDAVMDDSRVRKITFTGSTEVGKLLMKQASETVKNISLELGGHAPLIVFEDADIEKAIRGTVDSKFRNCGQVCIATNRVILHESIKDKYIKRLLDEVSKLKSGDSFDENIKLGPIINHDGFNKIKDQVEDAVLKGAKIILGGEGSHVGSSTNSGYFYKPTVLVDVKPNMKMFYEETFGPIIPIITFKTNEEAVMLANDTLYGLAAYFFTESISLGFEVLERLDYGIIGFNTGSPSTAQAPFGGFKESGLGREGGHHGLEEFLEIKYIALGL